MPYQWTTPASADVRILRLEPHQSLPQRGMALFILATFGFILLPVLSVLGSPVLWGLLPFLLGAVWAMHFALQRNRRARQITETLTISNDDVRLVRENPDGAVQDWSCNRYWVQVHSYDTKGPVPHYVTLRGEGREVEIGAFLSEEERIALFDELLDALR